jgi:hypothetical protein
VGGAAGLRLFLIEHDLQGLPSGHMTSAHDALDQAARLQARRGSQIDPPPAADLRSGRVEVPVPLRVERHRRNTGRY